MILTRQRADIGRDGLGGRLPCPHSGAPAPSIPELHVGKERADRVRRPGPRRGRDDLRIDRRLVDSQRADLAHDVVGAGGRRALPAGEGRFRHDGET